MKNLLRLMEEFSILGMPPAPQDPAASGMDFMPQGEVASEGEYELDADGNPLLDEEGNPIPKLQPVAALPGAAPACGCDHKDDDLAAGFPPPSGGVVPPAPGAMVPQLPPEDEFDFKV